jgi:hypothetical protein
MLDAPIASVYLVRQTPNMAVWLLLAWLLTLGPAIGLLRGRNAGDLMCKVTIYFFAVILGTRICNIWYLVTLQPGEPFGYLYRHGYSGFIPGLDRPVLLTIWICGGLAGHAFIYAASMLRHFWTTRRNRLAVFFYTLALLVGMLHPLPSIRYWQETHQNLYKDARQQLDANRALTDEQTEQWLREHPEDWLTLLLRAHFLHNTGRHLEAVCLYEKVLLGLPQERDAVREMICKRIE